MNHKFQLNIQIQSGGLERRVSPTLFGGAQIKVKFQSVTCIHCGRTQSTIIIGGILGECVHVRGRGRGAPIAQFPNANHLHALSVSLTPGRHGKAHDKI